MTVDGLGMGVVARRQPEGRRRTVARRIERAIREADRRSPEVAQQRTLIDAATRAGRSAVKAREQPKDAWSTLCGDWSPPASASVRRRTASG